MKKTFCLLSLIICFLTAAVSQSSRITRQESSSVKTLLDKHIQYNTLNESLGFRIQIFSESGNNSRSAALKASEDFHTLYPDAAAYVVFEEPYYKVKVGNFRARLEAKTFLDRLRGIYTNAFIVKDMLDSRQLLGIEIIDETILDSISEDPMSLD